jgi:hypothetical protein
VMYNADASTKLKSMNKSRDEFIKGKTKRTAIDIAMGASVTVSIGDEINGVFKTIFFVS